MTTLERARAHRREQLSIRAAALQPFRTLWRLVTLGDLRGTLPGWLDRVEPILRDAHERSAASSAAFYDRARADAISAGIAARLAEAQGPRFEVTPAPFEREAVRRSLVAVVTKTVSDGARVRGINLDDRAQVAAARSAGRHVLAGGRNTLEAAIVNDPAAVGWARVTDGNPCGFCAALASRGFVYLERDTALYAQHSGDPYHDGCGCTTMPRFRADRSPLPESVQAWQDLWYATGAYFTGDDALRAMRRAVEARAAGRDVRAAVFDGPKSDPDRYRALIAHDEATVEQYRREAQRGGTNGLAPDDPRRDLGNR